MKKIATVALFIIIIISCFGAVKNNSENIDKFVEHGINYLTHDSFRMELKNKIIYIDPINIPDGAKTADIILISHQHKDHMQIESINKISNSNTIIVAPITVEAELKDKLAGKIKRVLPWEKIVVYGINIETVPAYNLKNEKLKFHPKKEGYLGYIINNNGIRIYFSGDTDVIPEMKKIKCDIALLPVSGVYVMDYKEASEAVKMLKPKVVIPMHYGVFAGKDEDAENFKKIVENKNIKVIIKQRENY